MKGARSPEEAGLKLLRSPIVPEKESMVRRLSRELKGKHPDWEMFLKG